jgi:formamidopyrimidine-DNA glycosylase
VTHFLRLHLVGRKISKAIAPDDSSIFGKVGTSGLEFQKAVIGKTVVGAGRQGKYFWILLDSPPHPVMHLGMTGKFRPPQSIRLSTQPCRLDTHSRNPNGLQPLRREDQGWKGSMAA